eukprot:9455124-Prorocentrum_lima.AAC.1
MWVWIIAQNRGRLRGIGSREKAGSAASRGGLQQIKKKRKRHLSGHRFHQFLTWGGVNAGSHPVCDELRANRR